MFLKGLRIKKGSNSIENKNQRQSVGGFGRKNQIDSKLVWKEEIWFKRKLIEMRRNLVIEEQEYYSLVLDSLYTVLIKKQWLY